MTLFFGRTEFGEGLRLDAARSRRSIYLLGRTGMGKSNLMAQLALQALAQGEGVAVVDTKDGELARLLAAAVPDQTKVLYVAPGLTRDAEGRRYFGFNILDSRPGEDMGYAVTAALDLFTHLGSLHADFTTIHKHLMHSSYLALSPMKDGSERPPASLIDIRMILTDEEYRTRLLQERDCPSETRVHFQLYSNQKALLHDAQSTLPRLWKLLTDPFLNYLFGQWKTTIPLRDLLNQNYLILFDLASHDRATSVPAQFSQLLGSVVVSLLLQEAQKRPISPSLPHWRFCIDEFHLVTPFGIPNLIDVLRSRQVTGMFSHQHRGQLTTDAFTQVSLADAVTGIPINAFFSLSGRDLAWIKEDRGEEVKAKVQKLPLGHAYVEAWDAPEFAGFPEVVKVPNISGRPSETEQQRREARINELVEASLKYTESHQKVTRFHQMRYYAQDASQTTNQEVKKLLGRDQTPRQNRAGDRRPDDARRPTLPGKRPTGAPRLREDPEG